MVEVHDIGNHALQHSFIEFIDRDGSVHHLPGPDTVNFRRQANTTRTVNTFDSGSPTPGRASGVFIGVNGRAYLLEGKTNKNKRAYIYLRQGH